MSDQFEDELARWQRYAKSSVRERLSPWGKKCDRWEKRIGSNPYKLTVEEYQSLRAADFPFAVFDALWIDQYSALMQYREENGHCLVTQKWPERGRLGAWVNTQRKAQKKGKLSPSRQRALNRIGFCWDVKKAIWEQRVSELTAFIREHGHMRIPKQTKYEVLAHWIERIRSSGQETTAVQKRQLNRIGFIWKAFPARWETAIGELESFVREHGHADVPQSCRQYPKAAAMLTHQRHLYKEGTIDPVKRHQLEALGVRWHIYDAVWEERYAELRQIHDRHGSVRLPKGCPENKRLERWLRAQREKWHRLSPEYRERLAALGVRPEWAGKWNGYTFKELIFKVLQEAGPKGMKAEEIAKRLNAKRNLVTAWFYNHGKKTPEIEKMARGWYRYRR